MTVQELFHAIDVDFNIVVVRFAGNVNLLARFVKKFPEDKNFQELEQILKSGIQSPEAVSDAENAAHTLKGVTGNLGFEKLSYLCGELLKALRNERTEMIVPLFKEIEENYVKIVEMISQLD